MCSGRLFHSGTVRGKKTCDSSYLHVCFGSNVFGGTPCFHALSRALERMGVETNQLALARCAEYWAESARGEEPLKNGGSKQNFVAHTKFTVTDER